MLYCWCNLIFLFQYIGKSHNLWHRICLLLEQINYVPGALQPKSRSENIDTEAGLLQMEAFDSISSLYEQLKEEDLWGGLWQKRSRYPETAQAVALEQQGLFNQALACYERCFNVHFQEIGVGTSPQSVNIENELQWNHYLRYCNNWHYLSVCVCVFVNFLCKNFK